jgi:hypothetical protein
MSKAILDSRVQGLFNLPITPNLAGAQRHRDYITLARRGEERRVARPANNLIFYTIIVIPQGYNVPFYKQSSKSPLPLTAILRLGAGFIASLPCSAARMSESLTNERSRRSLVDKPKSR